MEYIEAFLLPVAFIVGVCINILLSCLTQPKVAHLKPDIKMDATRIFKSDEHLEKQKLDIEFRNMIYFFRN